MSLVADACVEVRRASLAITLDTTPPTINIVLADRVTPPEDATAMVVASEDMGTSSYALVDATGHSWPLGASRLDARTDSVRIPSAGLAGGDAWLLATVADEVGNVVGGRARLYVVRPTPYDLALSTAGVLNVDTRTNGVLGLDLDSASIMDLELGTYGD